MSGTRRGVVRGVFAALGLAVVAGTEPAAARHRRKRRKKRCRQRCAGNLQTCDFGCDILDGDSQEFCKQSCRVADSQCRNEC
jgi:hypothetical protein